MKLRIELDMDNDAFRNRMATETARILSEIARKIKNGATEGKAMDLNGNGAGQWEIVK